MKLNHPSLVFLMVAVGLITLPHVRNLPAPVFVCFALIWLWRFIGIWKPRWLPGKHTVFALTFGAIILFYIQNQGVLGRDAGTALFVTALGLKLLEIRHTRDIYLITYLAFVVAATQFLFHQSILMAGYILVVCWLLMTSLVSINSLNFKILDSVKTAGIIVIQALPLAIVLFILFPRLEAPRWLLFENKHQAVSGLSDILEPGSISRLGMSDELAFRVKFKGEIPPPRLRYWRGPVYSYTNGKRWSEGSGRSFRKISDKVQFHGNPYHYTLLMEPQNHHWVYALDMPSRYSKQLHQNNRFQLVTTKNPGDRAEYQVTSYPRYNTGFLTETEYRENLQLPEARPEKITALVRQLKGFDKPAEFFIEQLLNYFKTENFVYTLTPPVMEENPVGSFLFDIRAGFCGHYATAFVYLMRVAGVPARVVGGYQGGELNRVGGFLEVRQANAHAWAEVWLRDKGWVRVDPTASVAPERVEQDVNVEQQIASGVVSFTGNHPGWFKQARQFWNSIDYNWQRWVINYNSRNQNRFFESLGIHDIKALVFWLLICIAGISSILAYFILSSRRPKGDPVVQLYQRFCTRLAKHKGMKIKTGEGPLNFALRVGRKYPELADAVNEITALFIRIRYHPCPGNHDILALKKQVRCFKFSGQK